MIGAPEISTDGLHFYRPAIRDAFAGRAAHGVVRKTYSVTHLAVKEASRRYSPAQVIAVEYEAVNGVPADISTSLVERSHLTLRQSCKRFSRLGLGFSQRESSATRRRSACTLCTTILFALTKACGPLPPSRLALLTACGHWVTC